MPLGALISAGAGLVAGKKQSDNVKAANRQAGRQQTLQNRAVRAANRKADKRYAADIKFRDAEVARQEKWAQANFDFQNQFAKEGLRWRVEDAKAAGIHPLYALGANTHSFSPVSVGGVSGAGYGSDALPTSGAGGAIDTGMPNAIANAGQDIGRAISAMKTPAERMSDALTLENMSLQNDLLKAQIVQSFSASRAPGTGPGMPLTLFGQSADPSPHWSDAEEFQRRYGEPAEWAVALPIAAADLFHNYSGFKANVTNWKNNLPRDQFRYKYFQ